MTTTTLRCVRRGFADAVTFAAKALQPRRALPVLAGLRLTVTDSGAGVQVAGFDLETYAAATVDLGASVPLGAGARDVVVPGRRLLDLVTHMRGTTLTLTVGEDRVELACGGSSYRLARIPLADYPAPPTLPARVGGIDGAGLRAAITPAVAAARSASRVELAAIRVETLDDTSRDRLAVVGTDGFRASITVLDGKHTDPVAVSVPLSATGVVLAALDDHDVDLHVGDRLVADAGAGRRVITRVLDEPFADWRRLTSTTDHATTVVTDTGAMHDAASLASRILDPPHRVRPNIDTEHVTLTTPTAAHLEASGTEQLDAHTTGQLPRQVWVNAAYLADAVTATGRLRQLVMPMTPPKETP